jgi:hypothetical protein
VNPARRVALAVVAAVVLFAVQALVAARNKSPAFDEVAHVSAGVTYWTENDFRLQPENGNWPQRLIGLGVLFASRVAPLDSASWKISDHWRIGDQLLAPNEQASERAVMGARVPVTIVAALLGILVFACSRAAFGATGGWISLALYVFSPTMLAHGALATSDLIATAFFTAATASVWMVSRRVTPLTLGISCLAVGGLFLSKFSAPIIVPVSVVLVAIRLVMRTPIVIALRGEPRTVERLSSKLGVLAAVGVAHALVTLAMIWASYGFRFDILAVPSEGVRLLVDWDRIIPPSSGAAQLVARVRDLHLLPEAWLYGFSYVAFFSQVRASFLNGVFSGVGGLDGFFPYAALVKETIPAMLLVVLGLVALARRARSASGPESTTAAAVRGIDAIPFLVFAVVYWAFAASSPLNIGHRHLLPTIPATYILAGAAGLVIESGRGRRWIIIGLVAWHALESVRIAPNYLAYFNELDGGPRQAYRHLVDSSLDWGQDLPGVKRWIDAHPSEPAGEPIYLSYFGSVAPTKYGITATHLPSYFDWKRPHRPERLRGGTYFISATMLQGTYLYSAGPWTRQHEAEYQEMRQNLEIYDAAVADPAKLRALLAEKGDEFWVKMFGRFEDFRLGRLSAWLRKLEPSDNVGYSILIYHLSDEDVSLALSGQPPY